MSGRNCRHQIDTAALPSGSGVFKKGFIHQGLVKAPYHFDEIKE